MTSLLQQLDRTPPFWIFALARTRENGLHARRLTRQEVSMRSGLALRTIDRLSTRISWRNVTVEQVDAFMSGCGTNLPVDRRFVKNVFKRGGRLPHLTKNQMRTLNRRTAQWQISRKI